MGAQFQVNTYWNNWQDDPDVLPLRNGGFIITWQSYLNEYDDGPEAYYIAGQRYDSAGERIGGEIFLDGVDGGASTTPAAVALEGGGYAVTWAYSPDGILGQTGILTRAFDLDGEPVGRVSAADATLSGYFETTNPVIASAGDGYMVFFTADGSGSRFDEVYYRQYEADGSPVGRTRLLNTDEHYLDQGNVRATTLANGRVVAVWNSEATYPGTGDLESNELRATVLTAKGDVIDGDFSLARNIGYAGADSGPDDFEIAPTATGFAVSQLDWGSRLGTDYLYHITLRTFDADGDATSDVITVHRTEESVYESTLTTLESGEIVVVWDQRSEEGEVGHDILARVMSATGNPLSDVFEVSSDLDEYDDQTAPSVTGLVGGGFVVTYASENLDGDNLGIAARVYGRGTNGDDRLDVDVSGGMFGGGGDDRIQGDTGRNALAGGRGDDSLFGGNGADTLNGGPGLDRMWGGKGGDDFVFDAGDGRRDRIYGFGKGDEILIDNDVYSGLGRSGDLAAKRFAVIGEDRLTKTDRVLYDPDAHTLYYDPDGSGHNAREALVRLYNSDHVTLGDLIVV